MTAWPLAADGQPEDTLTALAAVHDAIRTLRTLEADLAAELGAVTGKGKGDLPDGRQYELFRSPDRKEWQHDEWKRDARRVLATRLSSRFQLDDDLGTPSVIDTETGEEVTLGRVLQVAMAEIQNVQGSSNPKSTVLKTLDLYASDYCTSSPGGWKFNAIAPSETTTETGEQK